MRLTLKTRVNNNRTKRAKIDSRRYGKYAQSGYNTRMCKNDKETPEKLDSE